MTVHVGDWNVIVDSTQFRSSPPVERITRLISCTWCAATHWLEYRKKSYFILLGVYCVEAGQDTATSDSDNPTESYGQPSTQLDPVPVSC